MNFSFHQDIKFANWIKILFALQVLAQILFHFISILSKIYTNAFWSLYLCNKLFTFVSYKLVIFTLIIILFMFRIIMLLIFSWIRYPLFSPRINYFLHDFLTFTGFCSVYWFIIFSFFRFSSSEEESTESDSESDAEWKCFEEWTC